MTTPARDAFAFLLNAANFLVRAYESAKAFLNAIPAAETGCVITDVRMPEINGLELLRRLKANEIGWPVIVITGPGGCSRCHRGDETWGGRFY